MKWPCAHASSGPCIWLSLAPMSVARFELSSLVIAGLLYIVGGYGIWQTLAPTSVVRVRPASVIAGQLYTVGGFDLVARSWLTLAPMSVARFGHSSSVIAGQLYIVGGYGIWQTLAPASVVRVRSASVIAGQLYIVGGYDPVARSWLTLAPLLVARFGHSSSVIAGQLYLVAFVSLHRVLCSCCRLLANLGTHVGCTRLVSICHRRTALRCLWL